MPVSRDMEFFISSVRGSKKFALLFTTSTLEYHQAWKCRVPCCPKEQKIWQFSITGMKKAAAENEETEWSIPLQKYSVNYTLGQKFNIMCYILPFYFLKHCYFWCTWHFCKQYVYCKKERSLTKYQAFLTENFFHWKHYSIFFMAISLMYDGLQPT